MEGERIIFLKNLKISKFCRYFIVGKEKVAELFKAPSLQKEYAPFVLQRRIEHFNDDVTCVDWSPDSKYRFFSSSLTPLDSLFLEAKICY